MIYKSFSRILFLFLMIFALCTPVSFAADFTTLEVDPGVTYPGTSVKVKIGDMLVTNQTSSAGLTGHAAIVTDNYTVVHIGGYGENPEDISISKFFKRYKSNIKVVRYSSSKAAKKAGAWATEFAEEYSDATYGLTNKLSGASPTYCSKIVWQAYYYGADVNFNDRRPNSVQMFMPYDILDLDDTSVVAKIGSW
ncbi:YiiX/YebB-like N1pC/P60 family cysteine hydrolase [Brevibacillus reuszeri]|uniref:YiiX/YebB-like N1pC/P60 family cysteine hydrolase n=1 Tax=Brevibacillus reuszeri TaxID=54915 RepID=UPI003D2059E5